MVRVELCTEFWMTPVLDEPWMNAWAVTSPFGPKVTGGPMMLSPLSKVSVFVPSS
jgi:hypothetical protein